MIHIKTQAYKMKMAGAIFMLKKGEDYLTVTFAV